MTLTKLYCVTLRCVINILSGPFSSQSVDYIYSIYSSYSAIYLGKSIFFSLNTAITCEHPCTSCISPPWCHPRALISIPMCSYNPGNAEKVMKHLPVCLGVIYKYITAVPWTWAASTSLLITKLAKKKRRRGSSRAVGVAHLERKQRRNTKTQTQNTWIWKDAGIALQMPPTPHQWRHPRNKWNRRFYTLFLFKSAMDNLGL